MKMNEQRYRQGFWILLGVFTVFRLVIAGQVGLGVDESHYALYARNFAWGYFDHPPMVGLLGAITTALGETPLTLRLGPIVGWTLSAILLRKLVLALYGREAIAFWSLVALLLLPVQHLLAMALLPDATLNPFWCACLLACWYAMRDGRWTHWLLVGVTLGCAMLSKYHGVLIPMCVFGYVVSSRKQWHWFRSPKPYTAGVVSLLVFLPNVLWNYRNDWISYKFQLGHGGGSGEFSLGKLAESFGGQLGAASPLLFVLLIAAWVVLWRSRPGSEADRFCLWMSLPVFAFFCGIGLFGKVLPHWPAVGWWAGSIVLSVVVLRAIEAGGARARRWRRWAAAAMGLGGACILLLYVAITLPVIEPLYRGARRVIPTMDPYRPKIDISNDLYGWEEAAEWAEVQRRDMPNPERTFVFCHRFFTTSQIGVYLDPTTVATSLHRKPSQYWVWFDPEDHKGWDAIFVDDNHWPQAPERYLPLFERVEDPGQAREVLRRGKVAHAFRVYRYFGFKGKIAGEG